MILLFLSIFIVVGAYCAPPPPSETTKTPSSFPLGTESFIEAYPAPDYATDPWTLKNVSGPPAINSISHFYILITRISFVGEILLICHFLLPSK